MNEINQREEELGRIRLNLVNAQEENKQLTVSREKFRQQNEFLAKDLKNMENEFAVQKRKIEEQQRLIDSLQITAKIPNQNLMQVSGGSRDVMMQKAAEEAQKNERIAMGTNRSTFLHLGENKTKLVSESESNLLKR
jgi:Tfp pilus assembly protein PilE